MSHPDSLARAVSRRALVCRVGGSLLCAWVLGCASSGAGGAWSSTKLAPAPAGLGLDPPPPDDLYWVRVAGAVLPPKGPGGLEWDEGGLPDPYFVLAVDGKEAMRSEPDTDTLAPTWTKGPRGNLRVEPGARLTVELLESDPVTDQPIGKASFGPPTDFELKEGVMEAELGKGAAVKLQVARAHVLIGVGLDYEMRGEICWVRQVMQHSPAGRAGLRGGDYILAIDGKKVVDLGHGEIKSALNAVPPKGLELVVQHGKGTSTERIVVAEGPVYPLFEEYGSID